MSLRVVSFDILKGVPASLGADYASSPIYLAYVGDYAIQLVFTGSPVGTFKLQASNDAATEIEGNSILSVNPLANWTDITGSDQAIAAAGNHMWNVSDTGYSFVRVVYTRTSGSGSLTSARLYLKGA